ncbi:GPP34 family phosphoprotein [Brachybacterium sp. JB7]|uniref:GOLPH3/VPS74 family protein n=1 Tax=Brachybacterium sp. JB7 TaxID=2024478 RepID=UPI000DF2ED93|nr:GPP34 family phosphoprotein [Brachybacterium sp. JB7]RCS60586.1 GPP34 family phosphoprotein [Brachybacterium sp. JB7]
MSTMTIPAELFLLLTNDAGRQDATQFRKPALAAAAVVELTLREKVAIGTERNPKVTVTDASAPEIPELDQAHRAIIVLDGKRLKSVISHRSMDLTEVLGDGLAAAGAVERKDGWILTSWPVKDPALETALRSRLAAAIADPSRASLQDAILLELLSAMKIAHRLLREETGGMRRRELDRVVKGLAVDHPAASALRRILDEMNTAIATQAAMMAN